MSNIITDIQVSGVTYSIQGSGGGTVSSAITSGDTNAVAGGAVYDKFDEVEQVTARALVELNDDISALTDSLSGYAESSAVTQEISAAVSGKTDTSAFTEHSGDTSIHHTSTSAVTSGSTSVITSGGVYEQLGGLKLVKLTQSAYDALSPNYDNNTLYVIVN